mmetsp:Transcript_60855/g.71210  ORF Transcript_60855/g.71210 Transcript_60855/m.71210 type:complete len:621 (-) Transcript_60855:20-1882(-)
MMLKPDIFILIITAYVTGTTFFQANIVAAEEELPTPTTRKGVLTPHGYEELQSPSPDPTDTIKDANDEIIEKMMADHILREKDLIKDYVFTQVTYQNILGDLVDEAEMKTDEYNDDILPRISHIKSRLAVLRSRRERLASRTELEVNAVIRSRNIHELEKIARVLKQIQHLRDSVQEEAETMLSSFPPATTDVNNKSNVQNDKSERKKKNREKTMMMLQKKLSMEELTKDFKARIMPAYELTERILETYALDAISNDTVMDNLMPPLPDIVLTPLLPPLLNYGKQPQSRVKPDQCITTNETISIVTEKLNEYRADGIGLYDHAAAAGRVVYADGLTSDPYYASSDTTNHEDSSSIVNKLSDLFVNGVWHTAKQTPAKLKEQYTSATKRPMAEEVLSPSLYPGSCYPIPNNDESQITIALPYPIHLNAVTIDHLSPSLSSSSTTSSIFSSSSAPQTFSVLGYPPCNEEDTKNSNGCSLGFNRNTNEIMLSGEYKKPDYSKGIWSVQTFHLENSRISSGGGSSKSKKEEKTVDVSSCGGPPPEISSEENGGSFAALGEAMSCGMPPPELDDEDEQDEKEEQEIKIGPKIQAVTIKLGATTESSSNNQGYICLYRIRLHGDLI